MPQPTLSVLDSLQNTVVINTINPNGQATMANSQPVVLASDQPALPLSTGAALAANQISGGPQLGGGIITGTTQRVVIATDQPAIPVTSAGIPTSLGALAPSASQAVTLPLDVTVGAAASIAAINTDLITGSVSGWYDAANFHSASIQIIGGAGISAGAIFFEQTNDITNAANGNFWPVEEDTTLTPTPNIAAITIAASTVRMFRGTVSARYIRVRVSTAFAGGTVQAVAVLSQLPYSRMIQTVAQATAGNMNVTVAGSLTTLTTLTTCTTVTTVTTLANGQTAHSAAATGSPLRIGGKVVTTIDTTLVQGDACDAAMTTAMQLVTKPFGSAENDWAYAPASAGILNSTTAVVVAPAGGASIRNYVTQIELEWEALATASEFVVRDGNNAVTTATTTTLTSASHGLTTGDQIVFTSIGSYVGITAGTTYFVTVLSATTFSVATTIGGSAISLTGTGTANFNKILYRTKLGTAAGRKTILPPTPFHGNANATIEMAMLTASATGAVYCNVSGYKNF